MIHRDRAAVPPGQGAGRRKAAGDPGFAGGVAGGFAETSAGQPPSATATPLLRRTGRQGLPTPADTPTAASPARSLWVMINAPWY